MWKFICKSFKNSVYLFRIQLGLGFVGVIFQLLYSLMTVSKSLVFIIFPKLIIDACLYKKVSEILLVIFLFSLVSLVTDVTIGITSALQSVYNLKFAHFFKRRVASKAMSMDYQYIESQECLDGLERAVDSAYELSGTQLTDLLSYLLKLGTLIYIVSTLNVFLAIITTAVVTIIYFINKRASKVNHQFEMEKAPYKRQQQYAENCVLNFNLAKDIKIYNSEPLFLGKYKAAFEKLLSIQVRKNRYNTFISLVKTLLNALLNGGTYIFLILKYSFGLVSISSFSMYLASVAEFYGAIDAVFFMFIDFYETNINLEEFEKNLSHRETLISRGNLSVNSVDSIEFKNVTFTYPGQSKPALDNVSFFIGKNEKVLLVGENGAGKTTIVKLLLRLYDVDKGEITVNGINIMDIRYDDYIKLMSPVFQDVKLFAYSVKENIILNKAFDSDRMNGSLDAIGIRGQIENTPRGIETCNTKEFDESGINFSGGEIQKIAIARALYQGGEVLIMDEPNSALDSLSERDLINNIKLISKDKMSIFISHRLSLSKTCDKIIVMNNGEVEEIGSHRELLKSHGLYYSLFSMQASKYTDSEKM